VEESSGFNGLLLKGADMMDDIKATVEKCPQTVSCADIMTFTTNEAMTPAGLPPQRPLGCRRSRQSSSTNLDHGSDDGTLWQERVQRRRNGGVVGCTFSCHHSL